MKVREATASRRALLRATPIGGFGLSGERSSAQRKT